MIPPFLDFASMYGIFESPFCFFVHLSFKIDPLSFVLCLFYPSICFGALFKKTQNSRWEMEMVEEKLHGRPHKKSSVSSMLSTDFPKITFFASNITFKNRHAVIAHRKRKMTPLRLTSEQQQFKRGNWIVGKLKSLCFVPRKKHKG